MSDDFTSLEKEEVIQFIRYYGSPVSKRDIAKGFNIKGDDRRILKSILKELEEEGAIVRKLGNEYTIPDRLPSVSVIEVTEVDVDGDVFARPMEWNEELLGTAPRIEIVPSKKGSTALAPKDRVLARLTYVSNRLYEGRVIKKLDENRGQVMGMVKYVKNYYVLSPVNKKSRHEFDIPAAELNGAQDGDLVVGEILPSRGLRTKRARIKEILGQEGDPKIISMIALHEAGLRNEFPEKVHKECKGLKVPDLGKREDLRDIPLVTIDGSDARDFDDAVYTEPDTSPENEGGYHLIVAIADVSYYVRFKSALDEEAYKRGNSTYFPDRVLPMLPEALSNDLCSLRPKEDRAAMVAHLWIDQYGQLKDFKITRALIRSAARLTYEQVQAAYDGGADDVTEPLMERVIRPLYKAYAILDKARQKRGALDLDLPERRIIIDDKGDMTGVEKRARLDAHKLIEEFMILANVAAAKALEKKTTPCVYRVHDTPSTEKLDSARDFVEAFGLSLPKSGVSKPMQINQLLKKAEELSYSHLISEVVLRCQSQAIYDPVNIGHFGLALTHYAHFTSPIRRYSDLLVHRALVKAYRLGVGEIDQEEVVTLEERCEHISTTERTSSHAERNSVDRFTAAYLSSHIGAEFQGKINGVTRFGLFVTLDENGADGLIPIRSLPQDFYVHDEQQHALIGRRTRKLFRLGAPITIRIKEADGFTGSTIFELVGKKGADIPGLEFKNNASKKPNKKRFKKDVFKKSSGDFKKKKYGAKPKSGSKPKKKS